MTNPENTQQSLPDNEPASQAATPEIPAAESHIDTLPSVEEQFRALELKAAEHHDAWLRAKAETKTSAAAHRKTSPRRTSSPSRNSPANCWPSRTAWKPPWPCREQTVDSHQVRRRTDAQATGRAFEKNALVEINPVGEKFDPHKHQAIGMVDSEQEANTVVTVLQKGY
jgi:molecular chaperone GrpE